jgi:hypothetical protein
MSDDEPIKHVRRPDLPWRIQTLTECGKSIKDVKACVERRELMAHLKKHGQQRTAFAFCMTCSQTCQRWSAWESDPVDCIRREVCNGRSAESGFRDELRGMALLVEKYREEFDEYLAGLTETVSLSERRRQKRQQAWPSRGSAS